jgi:hypothetical protein
MSRWGLVVLLVACTGTSATKHTAAGSGAEVTQTKKPGASKPTVNWVKGPALSAPAAELIAWFAAQQRNGEPRMTRVALVLHREKMGSTVGGFTNLGATIGPIAVNASDGALGISLKMRAQGCSGETCAFIVQGFWRGQNERGYQYEVREASRKPISPEELAAFTHAEVEGESGN